MAPSRAAFGQVAWTPGDFLRPVGNPVTLSAEPEVRQRGDMVSGVSYLPIVIIYFIPAVIAFARSVRNAGSVLVINLFLGWTLVGWIVALAMAVRTKDRDPGPDNR